MEKMKSSIPSLGWQLSLASCLSSPPRKRLPKDMPNDLRRPRTTRSLTHLTPLRIFLLCFVSAVYALLAIRFSLPPHNWLEAYVHRKYDLNDKVLHHRPAFRGVER